MTARLPMTPARSLTLLLGMPVLIALIGFTGLSVVGQIGSASFPVDVTGIPASGGQLTAQIPGNITLRQGPVSAGELTGTAHYSLLRASIGHAAGIVQFHCPFPLDNCELNGTLKIPRSTRAVSLSTSGGDVTIPDLTSDLTLRTDGGNLSAGTLTGALDLHTSGGDVNAGTFSGASMKLSLGGGNLDVNAMAVQQATIDSSGGDVTLDYTRQPTDLQISSGGGNVTLVVPRGQYKVSYNSGGGSFSNAAGDDPSAVGHSISIDSSGGDITISVAS